MEIQVKNMERSAGILKTIAHPVRLAIINLLEQNDTLAVNEICRILQSEQSVISHHLNNMRNRGLLTSVKSGNNVLYSIKESIITDIIHCLNKLNY
jgi:DNA-binding transcriptional ArsR family regulator